MENCGNKGETFKIFPKCLPNLSSGIFEESQIFEVMFKSQILVQIK
jgi:hypothetical protein